MLYKLKRLDWRKILTVFITFFIAWATGYAMQNSDRIAEIFGMDEPPKVENLRLASAETNDQTEPGDLDALSSHLPMPPFAALAGRGLMMPARDAGAGRPVSEDTGTGLLLQPREFGPFGIACGPVLKAVPRANAKVRLIINAPCHGEESLTIAHGPLELSVRVSKAGLATVVIPALARQAGFEMRLENGGEKYRISADVPDFADIERVALLWEGSADMRIHAVEMGSFDFPAGSGEGEIFRIDGFGVKKAEVYSFPAQDAQDAGVVRLAVEADVNGETCGREIEALTMQKHGEGRLDPVAIVLQMPGCEHVGQTLVLKNALKDLKIASN